MQSKFIYFVDRTKDLLDSMRSDHAHGVTFSIHHRYDIEQDGKTIEDFEERPETSGVIDGRNGIKIWQSEGIEPDEFAAVMYCAYEAILEAQTLIGSNWTFSEGEVDRTKYGFAIQPSKTLSSSGEPLSVDFQVFLINASVEPNRLALLSGQVNWQNGIHIWPAEGIVPRDFITIMATAHSAICEARSLIGSLWKLGGLHEPNDSY